MYIQTNGGPKNATNVLMLEAYKSAYSYNNMGAFLRHCGDSDCGEHPVLNAQNKFFKIVD